MKKNCFTLLEMIAAVTMAAIITAALFSAFHLGFSSERRIEQLLRPRRKAAAALEYIRQDLISTLPPTGILAGPFSGANTELSGFTGSEHRLVEFYTVNQDIYGGAHGIRKIEYVLLNREPDRHLLLARRITANLLAPVPPEPIEEVLCENLLHAAMWFYDGHEWRESWDSTTRDNILPRAVSVSLELQRENADGEDEAPYRISRKIILPAAEGRIE